MHGVQHSRLPHALTSLFPSARGSNAPCLGAYLLISTRRKTHLSSNCHTAYRAWRSLAWRAFGRRQQTQHGRRLPLEHTLAEAQNAPHLAATAPTLAAALHTSSPGKFKHSGGGGAVEHKQPLAYRGAPVPINSCIRQPYFSLYWQGCVRNMAGRASAAQLPSPLKRTSIRRLRGSITGISVSASNAVAEDAQPRRLPLLWLSH